MSEEGTKERFLRREIRQADRQGVLVVFAADESE